MRILVCNIVLILGLLSANAQLSSVRRYKVKLKTQEWIQLDTAVVDQGSVRVQGYELGKDYRLRADSLQWLAADMPDSNTITYRILELDLVNRRKDPSMILQVYEENPFNYIPGKPSLTESGSQLNTSGNISRGIGFGNAQDVVVNSNLNLRINGKLPNDVEVLAVISDENNPIQPEGNTQQIQDFDQVYITLKKDSTSLTVGDFLMARPDETYFLNYYKKSRGVQFKRISHKEEWRVQLGGEAAISRGRFSRNEIEGIDGNSGPYRLSGTNGEIFIMVIAGTEKVYLDGKQLIRGEGNDYVINYNTGEISFTPSILITRYSRIVVEFQYSDRNYARTVLRGGANVRKGNWEAYAHVFSEQDLRNQPFLQSLDGFDSTSGQSAIQLLQQVGDNNAFIPNVKPTATFNADRIMYRAIDSLGTTIYVHTIDPASDSAFYEVVFSQVGTGNGDYIQIQSAANGKVFAYVGAGQGDFAPVEVLVAPERLSMYTFGTRRRHKGGSSGVEFNMSSRDANTFSDLNDNDNRGYGLKLFRNGMRSIGDSSWSLSHNVDYEMISNGFEFVERYRSVEFNRQWNKLLTNPTALTEVLDRFEHIGNVNVGLQRKDGSFVRTRMSTYIRPGHFTGYNGNAQGLYNWNKTTLGGTIEWMNTETSDSLSAVNAYLQTTAMIEQSFSAVRLGAKWKAERSGFEKAIADSLRAGSFRYTQTELYVQGGSEEKLSYRLSVDQRNDDLPQEGSFGLATIGRNLSLNLSHQGKTSNRISLQTIYRNLEIHDSSIEASALDNSLQTRLEFDFRFLKDVLRTKTFIQLATGQEQRREFQFLQVQPGNGIYIWNDYDSNAVKTLNEFELASELDRARADYIKIFTPVSGFITTRSQKLSETFEINPAAYIKQRQGFKGFIARFYSLSSWIFEQKALPGEAQWYNPANALQDTQLISRSSSLRSSLFFNRSNPKFGMDLTHKGGQSKILLTNGFDSRLNRENSLNFRWNIQRKWTIKATAAQGRKQYSSEFFGNRDFDYNYLDLAPSIQFQYNNAFRVLLSGSYFTAVNDSSLGGETTQNIKLGTGFKYGKAGKAAIEMKIDYVKVSFDGQTSSSLGYDLLRGLQDGNNATWNINYQQKLAGNIQIVLSYDGRKSEDAPVIHLGRLVARYLF